MVKEKRRNWVHVWMGYQSKMYKGRNKEQIKLSINISLIFEPLNSKSKYSYLNYDGLGYELTQLDMIGIE